MSDSEKFDDLAVFLRMQLEELLEMADEDILEGADCDALKSESQAMIAVAKVEAGQRRRATARAEMAVKKAGAISAMRQVSLEEALAFLKAAVNDTRYTIAARSLGDMSDDDILRLYRQLHQLKPENESLDSGKN